MIYMFLRLIKFPFRLVFGTLYPAYRSYKAIKNKDVREYVSTGHQFRISFYFIHILFRISD